MARRLLDGEGRNLRNHYNMSKWAREDFRRRKYFARIDWILAEFTEDGIQPPDKTVTNLLAAMVTNDDSFVDLVLRKSDSTADLDKLREICAGVFYEMYIKAVEDGSWPET